MVQAVEAGWQARLALEYTLRRRTHGALADASTAGRCWCKRPLYPEGDAVCHSIIVHPPGGIAGGDSLELERKPGRRAAPRC